MFADTQMTAAEFMQGQVPILNVIPVDKAIQAPAGVFFTHFELYESLCGQFMIWDSISDLWDGPHGTVYEAVKRIHVLRYKYIHITI